MIEVLPIRLLTWEDAPVFGSLNVSLGILQRAGLATGPGIVITPPNLKLKTTLEHYDFGTRELFEQTLRLIKKEINLTPVPEILTRETNKHHQFFLNGEKIKSIKSLWLNLLGVWLDQIKSRLWSQGFYTGITEGLDPQVVIFTKKLDAFGTTYFDPLQDDVVVSTKSGKLQPNDLKNLVDLAQLANKKLFMPHEYAWILDQGIKLVKVLPYTPPVIPSNPELLILGSRARPSGAKSAVKVFFDLSTGITIEKNVEGIYIASEKIFDLEKPKDSFENLVFRLVESAITFPKSPVFFKLADQSEGMGKVRGTLRLLHQKNLLDPLLQAVDFARHKKGLTNIHIVIPFVRNINELLQIKRELLAKKLMRKTSLEIWMEVAVPENILNLEEYLLTGVDGVVLNLDELVAYLNGFDHLQEDLLFYKNEINGVIKFLPDAIKLLHKSKIPFIAYGSLSFYPKVLEFLVERGIYGIVVDRAWSHSAHDLLYQTEKRMILRKSM